jgi:GT2 family glycosyltransferase
VEWFLILNNDTWVAEDFFEVLFKAVNKYPKYAVFGPTIFYADYPDMVWYLGERVVPGTMLTINKYKGRVLPTGLPEVMPVDFLSGCAMLVKRQLFKDVGLLDTNFFMYGEEVDWCWRARRAGHRLAAVPDAFMWHKVSASSNRISSFARFLQVRNQIWGYRRYGNRYHKLMLFIFTLFRILSIFLNEIRSGQTTLWRSSLEGWVAGWWHDIPPVSEFL